MFGLFLAAVRIFAKPAVASAVFHQGPVLLALFLFAPLLSGWVSRMFDRERLVTGARASRLFERV